MENLIEHEKVGTTYSNFTDPQNELVDSDRNKYHIYCTNCGILILRANLGNWVERSNEKLKIPGENNSENSGNSENSSSDNNQGFWALDDILAFEYISVTDTLVTGVKHLYCAVCEYDIVPIGYHDTNMEEKEYLVAVDRVNYSPELKDP